MDKNTKHVYSTLQQNSMVNDEKLGHEHNSKMMFYIYTHHPCGTVWGI